MDAVLCDLILLEIAPTLPYLDDAEEQIASRPHPFCPAHAVAGSPEELGDASDFFVEWKWDGIPGQVIRRRSETYLWSRGEELMEGRWPEIEQAASHLPNGTVIDGEILAMHSDQRIKNTELLRHDTWQAYAALRSNSREQNA